MILIVAWAIVYKITVEMTGIYKAYSFPSPEKVGNLLITMICTDNKFYISVLASLRRVFIGYIIALGCGLILGFLFTKLMVFKEQLTALFIGFQTLPNVCWLPFAILWYGLNENAIIFIVTLGALFPISLATEMSISHIDPILVKAARTMGATGFKLYRMIIIPAALPGILAGLRQGWSFAWRGLIAGEMFISAFGLGQMLMMGREMADINRVAALMLIIIILGVFIDRLVFGKLQKRIALVWGTIE